MKSPEEWSEDPSVVSINPVVVDYRFIFAGTDNPDERAGGVVVAA